MIPKENFTHLKLNVFKTLCFTALFMLSGFMRMQAQTTISPGSNPNPIVVMGDSIAFNVSVASSQAWPNGTIKVTLPAGFRLLPSTPHIIAGSLAADGLSARIAAPTTGSVTAGSVVRTLYVKPLCDAETAVAAELRKIAYAFYADADASGAPVVSKETDQISNFYNPILSVVYPEGSDVILNTTLTRVISITQTANASHVNNLRINAAVTDKTGITVSKIEVTADTASHVWTDITATGLDASQAGKYVYNITRANTFAPLNYPDARMNVDAKLYIRETVTLIKCSAGLVQYSVSYGDGLDFCPPLPAAAGNINLSVATPAYGADILNGTGGSAAYITWPTSPTNDGVWRVRVLNTATTDPTAIMKDIYLNFGIGGQYYMKKAYICNPDGTIVPGAGGATDTLFLAMTPGTGTPRTDVNFVSTDPAMRAIYESIGFIDADGDGKYNDLNINKTVCIAYTFNITMGGLSTSSCNNNQFLGGLTTAGWGYYNNCGAYVRFGRAYQGGGASWWHGSLATHDLRGVTLKPAMVRTDDKAVLSFYRFEHANTNFLDAQHGATGTSTYFTDITLPDGLDFDTSEPYPVVLRYTAGGIYGGNNVPNENGRPTIAAGNIIVDDPQHIHIRILPDLDVDGTYMEIAVKANGNADPAKTLVFGNRFDYGNIGTFYKFGCHTRAVEYVLADNCNDIEMMNVSVERTSFGYTDKTKTTRMTKAAGANVSVIYPFDSVSVHAQMAVRGASVIGAADTLKVSASYSYGSALLNKTNVPGKLLFYRNGTLLFADTVAAADITQRSAAASGITTQYIEANIAKTLRTVVTNLQAGDSIALVLYTLSTENSARTNEAASCPVTVTLYRNSAPVCYPRIDDKVKFIRHTFNILRTDNTDGSTPWRETTRSGSADLFFGFSKTEGGTNLLTGGEYRPNVDNFSTITFVYNCLIKVDHIRLTVSTPVSATSGNEATRDLEANEYTVTYGGGKTTIVINPLKDHMFTGITTNAWVGYYLNVYWDAINMVDNFAVSKTVSFTCTEYPTSGDPQSRNNMNKQIGTDHNGSTIDFYKMKVTSNSPVQSPLGSIVEWPLTIENNSMWVNTDPVLPNTWIGFETPAGVTPSKLIDVTAGGTVVADIANAGEFLPYGSGHYWVKLGNVSCPVPHEYRLQCTYTVCSGTPAFAVKAGMSRTEYPANPQDGFSQYNSTGMAIHASSSVNVSFTPPTVDFSGVLTHRPGPTAQNIAEGTNAFCDTTGFRAEFYNGLLTEVSRLSLHINLPVGFDYNDAQPAKVKFGTGAWQTVESATQTGRLLVIDLDSTKILSGYGTPGACAEVDFRLRITCGAENRRQIYASFIGQSGCGAQVSKTYNSSQVRIAGLSEMPDYFITNTAVGPDPVIYTGASAPHNGEVNVTGQYYLGSPTGESGMMAIIDLPDNLVLDHVNSGLAFTQNGARLTAVLPSTDVQDAIHTFDVTLKPVNPELWNEDTVTVYIRTGRENLMSCDGTECVVVDTKDYRDSVRFAFTKLDVRFSETVSVRGSYHDATSEHVVIDGRLVNAGDYNAGELKIDLWYNNGSTWQPVSGAVGGLTVAAVPQHDSTAFTATANIPYTQDVCRLALLLRKTSGGAANAYLADSVFFELPAPVYEITAQPAPVCQMDANVPIGDQPIQGYTYQWLNTSHLGGAAAMPALFSYDYATHPIARDTTLTYLVKVTRPNGCVSTDTVFVPLKGIPSLSPVPADTALCNGSPLRIDFADNTNDATDPARFTTFTWTIDNADGTGLPASGATAYIDAAQLHNTGTQPITATVHVTPRKNGCNGVARTFDIIIYPTPKVNPVADKTSCSEGGIPEIAFSTSVTGATVTYRWRADANWSAAGLPAQSGTGNIPAFSAAANTGIAAAVSTVIVTPEIGACSGTPDTFTVTVNPVPRVDAVPDTVVCSGGSVSTVHFGTAIDAGLPVTYHWSATNAAAAGLPASSGTGDIPAFTAAANTGAAPVVSTITVTPKLGSCTGQPKQFTVTVNPVPRINPVSDIEVCSNFPVPAITFGTSITGATVTYHWTATNHAAVGLPASGTGSIASFTAAANASTTAAVSMITVTPKIGDCEGASVTFTLTINPTVTVNPVNDKSYFRMETVPAVAFSSPESNVTFRWTNSNPAIGLPALGTGNLPAFPATNTTTGPAVAISGLITVTPVYDGTCEGTPITFTIEVKPNPTITYYYDGGTAPATANPTDFQYGPALTIVNEPTREGYTFAGWTCPELNVTTPTKPFPIPANTDVNLSLYADWGLEPFHIEYHLNGGAVSGPPNPVVYNVETPSFTLNNPIRTGYIFKGWSGTGLTGDENLTVTIPTGSTGDRVYTANWTPIVYHITYTLNDGTNHASNPSTYTIEQSVTIAAPTRTGYDFNGWTGTGVTTALNTVNIPAGSIGDREYTATWSAIDYPVTYTMDGGTNAAANPNTYRVTSADITLVAPTKTGYTFTGWTGSNGSAPQLTVVIPTGSTGAKDYTANWTRNNYTISYTTANTPSQTGQVVAPSPANPTTYHVETATFTLNNPSHPGYTFKGWTGANGTTPQLTVTIPVGSTGDKTYTAVWALEGDFPISYTIDNAPSQTALTVAPSPANPMSYTIETATFTLNNPSHPGYTFKGWTGSNGTTPQLTVTIPQGSTGNKSYTANWALEPGTGPTGNDFTISYTINNAPTQPGQVVAPSPANPTTYNIETATFTLNNPSHPGYTFKGWTGSNGTVPQLTVTIPVGSTGNRTYTANWALEPGSNTFSIAYVTNNAPSRTDLTVAPANPETYTIETNTFTLNNPSHPGYAFKGWTGTNGTTPQTAVTVTQGSTGNRTYTANWEAATVFDIDYTLATPNGNGDGTVLPANPATYTIETATITLTNPTHPGYDFTGWSRDGVSGIQLTVTIPVGSTGDRAYTAHWQTKGDFTIGYDLETPNGEQGTVASANRTSYNIETATFTLTNPTHPGYTFTGWSGTGLTGNNNMTVTVPTGSSGNREYEAHWSAPIAFTIGYTLTTPTLPGLVAVSPANPVTYNIETATFTLTNPTHPGYTFKGWSGTDLTGNNNMTVQIPTGSHGDREYTAHWELEPGSNDFTIDYTLTTPTLPGLVTVSPANPTSYNIETATITLTNPTHPGYTFTGWSGTDLTGDNNMTVQIPTGSYGNRTYTAHWALVPGTGPTGNDFEIDYTLATPTRADQVIDPSNPVTYNIETATFTLTNPTHPGYTFTGWSGTGLTGDGHMTVTIPTGSYGNRTYTAHWTVTDNFLIDYTLATPVRADLVVSPSNRTAYNIETPAFTLANPTHPGYPFAGWSGTDLTGTANTTVTVPTGSTGDRDYTAHWGTPNTFVINYNLNSGTNHASNPATYTIESADITLGAPTRGSDDTFIGWTGTGLTGNTLSPVIPTGSTGNRNYTARWAESLDDINGGVNDTLYACGVPRMLYGDPSAVSWTWTLPDGSLLTTRGIAATLSGRYICLADYGSSSIVRSDTLYAFFLADANTRIEYISTHGAKIGRLQQFTVNLPDEILSKATLTWTLPDGGTIVSATDTLTALWTTTGEKYVFLQLDMHYGGLICSKALSTRIKITERGLGLFVNESVSGGAGDGSSWANAFRTLDEALAIATPGDRVWVAEGVYTPDAAKGTFVIPFDSIEIYGGFNAHEEYLYERNPSVYSTVLHGDGQHPTVTASGCAGIRIDGFTIENGRADNGAGVYLPGGSTGTLANSIVKSNVAVAYGGGVYASAPLYGLDGLTLINTEISGNHAGQGAGMYNAGYRMKMLNTTVSGNRAEGTGGLYNTGGAPQILNSIIWGNVSLQGNPQTADVLNAGGSPRYVNSLIGGSNGSGANWAAAMGIDGGGNYDVNPLFLYRGTESDNKTLRAGNYRLSGNSPAVDAGNNSFVIRGIFTPWNIWLPDPRLSEIEGLPNDLDYNFRVTDDDMVDMGAYEYNSGALSGGSLDREVILPFVDGVVLDPGPGIHYVESRGNFVFTVTPSVRYTGEELVVTTSRTRISDREGVSIKQSSDGKSYIVTIHAVQDKTYVYISFGWDINTDAETVTGARIWSHGSELHVLTVKEASTLRVYTLSGSLLHKQPLPTGETVVPLPQGVYVISLDDSGMRQKVVIK